MTHSIELEQAVLGAIILEKNVIKKLDFLTGQMFYDVNHVIIFEAIKELERQNSSIDLLMLTRQLLKGDRLKTIGGAYAITQLTNRVATSGSVEIHARKIQELFFKRELVRISEQVKRKCGEEIDVFNLIDFANKEIAQIINSVSGSKETKSIYDAGIEVIELAEKAVENKIKGISVGVPIKINKLSEMTGGWQGGELIILAARPGMGKTACALDYCYHPAKMGIPTGFFSLEMPAIQLTRRIIASESNVSSQRMVMGELDHTEVLRLKNGLKKLNNVPMYIDDSSALTIQRTRSKAVNMVNRFGVQLLVVDYLQLMSGSSKGNRESEISEITRGLKNLAKELNIPIIALSQLSRNVEQRASGNKMPQLSDLRESGAIEQDADMVIFLYRPEYYGDDVYEYYGETISAKGLLLKNIAKFRAGETCIFRCTWHGSTTSIHDYGTEFIIDEIKTQIEPNNDFL